MNWNAVKKHVEAQLTGVSRFVVEKADWYERKNMTKVKDLELVIPFELHELISASVVVEVRSALIMVLWANKFKETPYVRIFAIY